jgi:O-acetyl-ADP-ribose deacetylase (regulator of RNase III)
MRWQLHHGDILDVPADILVCSANVYLTLSGGVGGAFLLRYGRAMQDALNAYLIERNVRHVEPGDVITTPPCGSPYRAVLHAVAVDGTYHTTSEIVARTITTSLRIAAAQSASTVAMTALACGYGQMPLTLYARALIVAMREGYPPIHRVTLAMRGPHDVEELHALVPELELS